MESFESERFEPALLDRSADSTLSASSSASLNECDSFTAKEIESLRLLREIFPEESTEELWRIHQQRIGRLKSSRGGEDDDVSDASSPPNSPATQPRLETPQSARSTPVTLLPYDFLRLPLDVAVRRFDEESGLWHYEILEDLAQRAYQNHERLLWPKPPKKCYYYTKAVYRDDVLGLGLTLFEQHGLVRVHSLSSRDGRSWMTSPLPKEMLEGPALQAGILPGDVLIGMNGTTLFELVRPEESLLKQAVLAIRASPDPIVLHFERAEAVQDEVTGSQHPRTPQLSLRQRMVDILTPSLLDMSEFVDETKTVEFSFDGGRIFHSTRMVGRDAPTPLVHPFVARLREHGILHSYEDERTATLKLAQLEERTRQWEATNSFRIEESSTGSEIFIPLFGVRKAISVHIVNSFLDGTNPAYTIWVYDVETGKEWYAPVRYLRDFQDLRSATMRSYPFIAQFPFPKQTLSIFGSPVRQESPIELEAKFRQLEQFLRAMCAMIYRSELHPAIAEVAVYVQSFLGCDNADLDGIFSDRLVAHEAKFIYESSNAQARTRRALKQSIQRYTYRLFLLDRVRIVVDIFVDAIRSRGPRLDDLEALEAQGRAVLKARAMEDLEQMRTFLDKLQEIVLEGCMDDFRSIAEREDYESIHGIIHGNKGDVYWQRLVREAVRQQVEIEVYVPLRSVVSRWLVKGWRHEDMEVQFKIRELRKRPQRNFRIQEESMSPSNWASVSTILKESVGMSTLPCVKLRAIVESSHEITRLLDLEHGHKSGQVDAQDQKQQIYVGADDFLPIFIYCVVQAEMERPCALCVLLRTLCDPINRLGEVGYFLASFEAAITHIQELDLSEDREEMPSFLSVSLSDN